MTAFLYLIPLLGCAVLYMVGGSTYEWWYYVGLIVGSMAFTGIIHYFMHRHLTMATEKLGGYITDIRHEDSWTEIQEYTEQEACGRDSDGRTIYRTVKKKRYIYHPEYWIYYTSVGYSHGIDSRSYNQIAWRWGSPRHDFSIYGSNIVGGVRYGDNYYFKDSWRRFGAKFDPFANIRMAGVVIPVTESHKYKNKVQSSNSIFRFEKITPEEAREEGLYNYPNYVGYDQSPVVGREIDNNALWYLRLINAYYGAICQIRVLIVFFDANKGIEIAERQRAYWKGGNKNEFVVCLGMEGNKVEWCHTFSWMDEPVLGVKTEDYFRQNRELDMQAFGKWLRNNLGYWKRKEFSDFDYIRVELTQAQYWSLMALTMAINGVAIYLMLCLK